MAVAAYGVEEKYRNLRMRKDDQRKLAAHIEEVVRQAEGEEGVGGCTAGPCGWMRRRMAARRAAAQEVGAVRVAVGASTGTHSNLEMHRAVFGLAGAKKADPAAKLDEAAQVMRARIAQLDERAVEGKAEAARLMKAGQKAQAMRALKKAKAVEAQAEANQSSLMAVEQQVDMLAQAAMQKTLASALATTSKSMKKDAKALGKAEAAIDDAAEARDMASDLNTVMADFAHSGAGEVDEDELMAELEGMMAEDAQPPPPTDAQATERARLVEIADLEAKLAARKADREHNEEVREAVKSMPSAPTGRAARREEKAGLLAASVGA
ncbi:MAG: Snf7 family protein [Actinomycetales bacterium]